MKKFVFLYCGMDQTTVGAREAWMAWFAQHGESFIDGGNPFGQGRVVTSTGSADLPTDGDAIMAYSIVRAESAAAAEQIAATCPAVTEIRVFEALPM
jgi:hypothetical protein